MKPVITQCCVCRKVHVNGEWREETAENLGWLGKYYDIDVTHTYCDKCAKQALKDADREIQKEHLQTIEDQLKHYGIEL